MRCAGGLSFKIISIHALREEGDFSPLDSLLVVFNFYPRPPRGGRPTALQSSLRPHYFYPRPPRGGRPVWDDIVRMRTLFLSTPSARRATSTLVCLYILIKISIHALREEGDGPPNP